ncbi:MAG: DNA-binding winged helix-turn-helix (wHTH) protein [Francisellaceae bacterium]|jgi:DNA-binding winged helix-turn-helix (wHTH) protein
MDITNNIISEPCEMYCSKCPLSFIRNVKYDVSISTTDQSINIEKQNIKFSSRSFRVLCALLRQKEKTLSFHFLQQYGWPDSNVVRNNLTVAISEIRTHLRHTNLRIENVRGHGYLLTTADSESTYNGIQYAYIR